MATKDTKQYIATVGRRKTAVARVRLSEGTKQSFTVNGEELAIYFPTAELRNTATEAISKLALPTLFVVTVMVKGGGKNGQAVAVRLGTARALVALDLANRTQLKQLGFLTRDPRQVERKHFGLKKARKASQWSKR
jgi:small subunit ribosomal protein S9